MHREVLIEELKSCHNGARPRRGRVEAFLLGYRYRPQGSDAGRRAAEDEDTDIWSLVGPITTNLKPSQFESTFNLEGLGRELEGFTRPSDSEAQKSCGPEQHFLVFNLGDGRWGLKSKLKRAVLVKSFRQLAEAA